MTVKNGIYKVTLNLANNIECTSFLAVVNGHVSGIKFTDDIDQKLALSAFSNPLCKVEFISGVDQLNLNSRKHQEGWQSGNAAVC